MAKPKSNTSKSTQPEKYNYHPDQFAGTFDLLFLKPQARAMSYEDELLTAEEKAAYYEDLVQNWRVVRSCAENELPRVIFPTASWPA